MATKLSVLADLEDEKEEDTGPQLLPGSVSINSVHDALVVGVTKKVSPTSRPSLRGIEHSSTKAQLTLYESLGVAELLTSGPTEAIYKVWQSLDTDGNGSLSKIEFDEVNRRLAVKWDQKKAWQDAVTIQTMQDLELRFRWKVTVANKKPGDSSVNVEPQALASERAEKEISFRVFVSVYNQMLGTIRRHARRDIKAVYESMVNDPQGLRTWELAKMIRKVEKQLFILAPRYDEEKDLQLLLELSGVENLQKSLLYIDFLQFERWWKYRVGLLEADTPVIPEFFEYKMVEMSEAARIKQAQDKRKFLSKLPKTFSMKLGRGKPKQFVTSDLEANYRVLRSGADLWDLLRSRMKMLLTMRRDWGDLDDVYGHFESDFSGSVLKWYIRDPNSQASSVWDLLQVVFLMYVTWTVPLRACFGIDIEIPSVAWVCDTVVDVYFLTDLGMNFVTAYDSAGIMESRVGFITRRYLKSWFALDFLSCIPVNYITMAIEADAGGSMADDGEGNRNFRAFKAVRLFRLSKMLRLARIKRILSKYEDLEFVRNYSSMFGLGFVIVFMAHILSCMWYVIGLDDSQFSSSMHHQPGWVLIEYCAEECNLLVWSPDSNGITPASCLTYSTMSACPMDRCHWGQEYDLPTVDFHGVSLPQTLGISKDSCVPKKFCLVGCEENAITSLTMRYVTSMCKHTRNPQHYVTFGMHLRDFVLRPRLRVARARVHDAVGEDLRAVRVRCHGDHRW